MLAPWKKSYDQPRQHIKKQRHYLANKVLSNQSYGFSSSHIWCGSWTIKKAECWRIDALELWCWRRLLGISFTTRRSNLFIQKEISPEYSLEGLMVKLKLQYFVHLIHLKRPQCWERCKAGGEGDNRGWYGCMASLTQWAWVWVNSGSWWWTGNPSMLQYMESQRVGHDWTTELSWTEYLCSQCYLIWVTYAYHPLSFLNK